MIADSQREYNGNEISKTESSTHSIMVLHPLLKGDIVKVQFNKDGTSYIHSDNDHDVHFRLGQYLGVKGCKFLTRKKSIL